MTTPPSPVHRSPHPAHALSLLTVIVLPLLVVGWLSTEVLEREELRLEAPLMEWLHRQAPAWFVDVAAALHTLGGPVLMGVLFTAVAAGLWLKGHPRRAQFVLFALGGTAIVNTLMKLVFSRPRPELWDRVVQEHGASFPSGHSMFAAAISTALVLLAWRTPLRWLAAVLGLVYTLLMMVSRLVLGVHYPSDVLAGALGGMAWVYGIYRLMGGRPVGES